MKIIDETGRLFGKVNIIDFMVILFLAFLTPALYLGYKIIQKKPAEVVVRDLKELEIDALLVKVSPQTLGLISLDDKEIDENGALIGSIIWIGEARAYHYKFNIGSGIVISKEAPELKEIPVRLKIKAEIKDKNIYYKDRQIAIDSPLEFHTDKYTLDFFIVIAQEKIEKTEEEENEERIIDLNVIFKGISQDTINLIQVGDKELDDKGNVLVEILDIGRQKNDLVKVDLGNNNFVVGEDASKRQINAKLKLRGLLKNNKELYFKGKRITFDSAIRFKTDKYAIEGFMDKVLLKEKWVRVRIKFMGIDPEVAKLVSEGDAIRNEENKIIGRVKTIISNNPTSVQTISLRNYKFVSVTSPDQRDIEAMLELSSDEKEGALYFRNIPLKIGSVIRIDSDLYSVDGSVFELGPK